MPVEVRGTGEGRLQSVLRLGFGFGVSLGCLYVATRGTDWGKVGSVVAAAHPIWVVAVVAASVFSYYVRAQRWRILLRPVGQVALYPAMSATAIGFGATMVLPLRLGEIIRPALLGRNTGIPVSAALSSVLLERIFDMLMVVAFFVVLGLGYAMDPWLQRAAAALAVAATVASVVLFVMARNRNTADRFFQWGLGLLPGRLGTALRPIADGVLAGLSGIADVRTVLLVLASSAALWTVIMMTYMFSLLALDVQAPPLPGALAAMVIVAMFVFVPQGPGFVGTWQLGCVAALGIFHVPEAQAVGYSLFTWVVQMTVNIGIGGVFLSREDVSLGQLLRSRGADEPAREPGV